MVGPLEQRKTWVASTLDRVSASVVQEEAGDRSWLSGNLTTAYVRTVLVNYMQTILLLDFNERLVQLINLL